MTTAPGDALRARAEARFKLQEERASDAQKVRDEVQAAKVAESAKTDRLRALRLAKEEEDRRVAAATPPPKGRSKKAAT